jgi:DNA-binding NarL/FixJ family response regulator
LLPCKDSCTINQDNLSAKLSWFSRPALKMPKPYPSSGTGRVKEAQATKPIRVLVEAQHALVRAGIRALVEQIPDVEVVAEAEGQQSFRLIKEHHPDILLLDVILPSVTAFESLKEIVEKSPKVRVIVLTLEENQEYAIQAFRAGAAGYISKNAARAELEKAIKSVARGENYLGSELSQQAVLKYLKDPRTILSELTARQREVLKMIAEGHATKEIARRLNISVKTVETHRAQVMERLDIHDVVGLVRYALRIGLVKLDE